MTRSLSFCLCLALAFGTGAAAEAPPAGAAPGELLRQSRTITGQRLELPDGPIELVASVREIPPGGVVPMHRHRWQRYAYVEKGRIRVTVPETGLVREFGPGDVVVEPRGQWHEGHVIGDEPVRLVVYDQLPPGQTNMELKGPR